jgi:hypothetical protein
MGNFFQDIPIYSDLCAKVPVGENLTKLNFLKNVACKLLANI